jgi:acylphosphatase
VNTQENFPCGASPSRAAGLRLHIFGRVQGVGFRYWAYKQALRLQIRGWIRNEADGTVSCECYGTEDAVKDFTETLRKGPPYGRVDKIETSPASQTSARKGFEIT